MKHSVQHNVNDPKAVSILSWIPSCYPIKIILLPNKIIMIKIIIIIKINIFTFRVIRIGEIIFSKVGKSVSYFIVKYRFPFTFKISFLAANIYIYIFRSPVCGSLQFSLSGIVSHVHVLSRERRAIYQKTRGNNSRHTKCKHTFHGRSASEWSIPYARPTFLPAIYISPP